VRPREASGRVIQGENIEMHSIMLAPQVDRFVRTSSGFQKDFLLYN
jgi:hypothetical protein